VENAVVTPVNITVRCFLEAETVVADHNINALMVSLFIYKRPTYSTVGAHDA
jgi:hypothetical protein